MKRDFAAKNKKRGNATRFDDSKPDNSGLITIVLGVVLGVGLTLLAVYYYNQPTKEEPSPAATAKKSEIPSAKKRYQAIPPEEVEQSEFSFHDELENKTIEVNPKVIPEKTSDKSYVMQCGSFRKRAMADNLKASIAFTGLEANINSSLWEGEIWHRVIIGPYQSKRKANQDRHKLQRNNINGCIIW